MKKPIAILTLFCLMGIMMSLNGCGATGDSVYYANHPTQGDALAAKFGPPIKKIKKDDGREIWVFAGLEEEYSNRYFVIKDGMVVDGGVEYNGYND